MHPHARGRRRRPLSPGARRHAGADPLTREHPSRAVLVTGCSSGIGAATAARLATAGWTALALCRDVLPGMREQGWGKIVNVSSMGGRFTFPGGGLYHATKHALEALSDALRFEVAGFGVDVILIEPGIIKTGFGDRAVKEIGGASDGPYGHFNQAVAEASARVYEQGPLSRLGGPPEAVAERIEAAISAKRPRARYPVTPSARVMMTLHSVLPQRAWDTMLATSFPRPR